MNFVDLPKGDLHCHLAGSLTVDDIKTLANEFGIDLRLYEPLDQFVSYNSHEYWNLIRQLFSFPQILSRALSLFLSREAKDGVVYAEPIINLGKIFDSGVDQDKLVESLDKTIRNSTENEHIRAQIRLGVNRTDGPERVSQMAQLIQRYPQTCFAGIDLNGDEKKYPNQLFLTKLEQAHHQNIHLTVHAGEFMELEESALSTAKYHEANRIGHGLALAKHPEIFADLRQNDIILEICLSSNLMTKAITALEDHPVKIFEKNHVPYVLATDDPGMTRSFLSHEYQLLSQLGVGDNRLKEIAELSLTSLRQYQRGS